MSNYRQCGYPTPSVCEQSKHSHCHRQTMSEFPDKVSVAMVYVPFQQNNDVYPCEKALLAGTIFPVLDKPFLAGCLK